MSVIADLFGNIRRRPESALPATDCAGSTVFPGLTAIIVRPPFHRPARIIVVAPSLDSKASARSREPLCPASPSSRAHTLGPSRPRRRRPSAHPHCRSLPGSGSLKSPSPRTVKARHPPAPDRLRRQRSTSFRALGHLETQRPAPASMPVLSSTTTPAPSSSL